MYLFFQITNSMRPCISRAIFLQDILIFSKCSYDMISRSLTNPVIFLYMYSRGRVCQCHSKISYSKVTPNASFKKHSTRLLLCYQCTVKVCNCIKSYSISFIDTKSEFLRNCIKLILRILSFY